jgi:hypothetical protein
MVPSGLERLPLRPLIGASVILALVIGAVGYLRTSLKAKQQPVPAVTSAPVARAEARVAGEDTPVIVPGLQPDAIQHARSVERLVDRAITDLSAAEASLNKVRPYAGSDVDQAADKVESARRGLAAAREQAKVVRALVDHR